MAKKITTEKEAIDAVREDSSALKYVPAKFKTATVCLAAVKNHGCALEYVPLKLKTAAVCLAAVQNKESYIIGTTSLEFVPEELKIVKLCLVAVKHDGFAIQYVPERFKTEGPEALKLCLAAVRQNGFALQHVPEKFKTKGPEALELCLAAVKKSGLALQYVPEKLKTETLCLTAVKQDGYAIQYVPKKLKTEGPRKAELWLEAAKSLLKLREEDRYIKSDLEAFLELGIPMALKNKVEEIFDDDDVDDGVNLEISSLKKALNFVRKTPEDFLEIPKKWRTREVCLLGIVSFGSICEYIPKKLQSEDFFFEAVKVNTNGKALKYTPKKFRTLKICLAAVEKNGEALEYVPKKLQAQVIEALKKK
ncbi:MAG: DUF4116 domain-containing protein [Treponema sp.]|nr:DUF4116 domain-containing protein [Treponema sp.]